MERPRSCCSTVATLRAALSAALSAALYSALWLGAAAQAAQVDIRVTGADGKPLSGAVVYLESKDTSGKVKPLATAEIAQVDKNFVPAVSVVTVGTPVGFPNRDTVRHHVYSFSEAKRFEIKLYVGTPEAPVVFDKPGIAVLGCNIHDQMTAWVVVVDTPWWGRTDAEGRWVARNVPEGAYRLRTWHASLAAQPQAASQPLRVDAGDTSATVNLIADSR